MPETTQPKSIHRFGLYELDSATGELCKDGRPRLRLQGQPLEVLLCLLGRSGDVVTREELRSQLWPTDTFVDYDHSLNTAVNKLRDALNDSAENPRFIQTIPRRGYRFIAAVQVVTNGGSYPGQHAPQNDTPSGAAPSAGASGTGDSGSFLLSDPADLPDAPRGSCKSFLRSFK